MICVRFVGRKKGFEIVTNCMGTSAFIVGKFEFSRGCK